MQPSSNARGFLIQDTKVNEDRPNPRGVSQHADTPAQPDDAPMNVHSAQLPDGRYCLLFTFGRNDPGE